MIRRRFYSSYKSPVDNGVYAVKQDGRLIPLSKADYQCISVAIVHDDHKIMIEKNEDSNQSYKTATSGLPDSSNKTYSFYWGEYGTDQTDITNYSNLYGNNIIGYLKPESGSYNGTPNIPENVSSWTSGALSDWEGKANSEVLKEVIEGGKYMIYSQIMSLNPRERAGLHPPGHPPPSHCLPVLFGFLLVLSSNFHIFGTKR